MVTNLIALLLVPVAPLGGMSGPCGADVQSSQTLDIAVECTPHTGVGDVGAPHDNPDPYEDYYWMLACRYPFEEEQSALPCSDDACPEGLLPFDLMGLRDGSWHIVRSACRGEAAPIITPAQISTAFQRIPLPHLRTIAQPGAKTLVNFDTIFHVEAEPLRRNLTLLGQRIELDITASSFGWNWGDGHTETTHTPGAPYPDKSVTHRYLDADTTVSAQVTVTWTARWRVNGGAWADVPGSVRTTGPAATLRVVEAVPNLSGPD